MHRYDVLIRPLMTEATEAMGDRFNRYAFEVARDATKPQIREAVERIFNVSVTGVNTMVFRGKQRRFGRRVVQKPSWKKAIVTVAAGQSIDLSV